MQLSGLSDRAAIKVFRAVEHEIARLERIFSLYLPHSQIRQLNTTGQLRAPAPEFIELLDLCAGLHAASGGAFDPTIQPLWQALARAEAGRQTIDRREYREIAARCGWQNLRFDSRNVTLSNAGALTLNGIAQGFITDRIAMLLRARGLSDILIDMGEIAAIGPKSWQVGIALPDHHITRRISLSDRAIASSAPAATLLSPEKGLGHILDPRSATPRKPPHRLVSVSAPSAALADGLSTSLCLLKSDEMTACLSHYPDANLELLI